MCLLTRLQVVNSDDVQYICLGVHFGNRLTVECYSLTTYARALTTKDQEHCLNKWTLSNGDLIPVAIVSEWVDDICKWPYHNIDFDN